MDKDREDTSRKLEANPLTQEQLVSELRTLAVKDLGSTTLRYIELVDSITSQYERVSDEAKQKILDAVVEPLTSDEPNNAMDAVAKMKNPYVVGDIIRQNPTYFPGSSYYEQDLTGGNNLESPATMQAWLDGFSGNYFAALSLVLQRPRAEGVSNVIKANDELFQGAAHIMASWHDYVVSRKVQQDPSFDKDSAFVHYRAAFVDDFRTMVQDKVEEACWL